jgi:hypothetical protein
MVSLGALPSVSVGPMIMLGASLGKAALHVEGRYDFPSSKGTAVGGEVSGSLLLGSLVPCFEPRPVLFCGIVSTGALFGKGDNVIHPKSETTSYSALGARVGLDVSLFDPFRGRIQLEGDVPLRPTALRMAGTETWKTPPAFATLSFVVYGYGPR